MDFELVLEKNNHDIAPAVSVVIPLYNSESSLEVLIECLARQSFRDFETIFVNDGSQDETLGKIRNILDCFDGQFKLISQENQGTSVARNNGISVATGRYVICVDSDDLLAPSFLETLYRNAVHSGLPVSLCDYKVVSRHAMVEAKDNSGRHLVFQAKEIQDLFLKRQINIVVTGMMIEKSFLLKNSLFYDSSVEYGEDAIYIWKVLLLCDKYSYDYSQLYGYYVHEGSKTTAPSLFGMTTHEKGFRSIVPLLENRRGNEFARAAYSRAMFALVRITAVHKDFSSFRECFDAFLTNECIQDLCSFSDRRVRVLAFLLKRSPFLFYIINHCAGR